MKFLLAFLPVLLLLVSNNPMLQAEAVYAPPPVEKVKKKKKVKEKVFQKRRRARKSSAKQHFRQKNTQIDSQSRVSLYQGLMIFALSCLIVGAFLFPLALSILGLWITGLILMGIANIIAFVFWLGIHDYLYPNEETNKKHKEINDDISSGALILTIALYLQNAKIGIIFLIWGLVSGILVGWITGIVVLVLCLVALLVHLSYFW